MVSVNLHNIQELLPEVEANIEKAAFIAIDTEFSGLNVASVSRESRFDEAEHRYDRLRRNVTDASLLQLGLACFIPNETSGIRNDEGDVRNKDAENPMYKVVCYNLILAPADVGVSVVHPKNFISEWGAMRFLRTHGFDINQVIDVGVPYLKVDDIEKVAILLLRGIASLDEKDFSSESIRLAEQEAQKIQAVIEEMGTSTASREFIGLKSSPILLHHMLREMFPLVWTMPLSWSSLKVYFVTAAQRAAYEKNERSLEEWILKECSIGGRIFAKMVKERKAIIGFQLLQDLMFVVDTFYGSLPEKYVDFKNLLRDLFPQVYDGKVMATTLSKNERINMFGHLDAAALDELFQTLTSSKSAGVFRFAPQFQHDARHSYYEWESHAHEAAYDAFMAGGVFLYIIFAVTADKRADVRSKALQPPRPAVVNADRRPPRDVSVTLHGLPPLLLQNIPLDIAIVHQFRGLLYLHLAADKFVNILGTDEQADRSKAWVRLSSEIESRPISSSKVVAAYLEACVYEHKVNSPHEIIIACPNPDRAVKVAEYGRNSLGVKADIFDSVTKRKLTSIAPAKKRKSHYVKAVLGVTLTVAIGVALDQLRRR